MGNKTNWKTKKKHELNLNPLQSEVRRFCYRGESKSNISVSYYHDAAERWVWVSRNECNHSALHLTIQFRGSVLVHVAALEGYACLSSAATRRRNWQRADNHRGTECVY